MLIQSATERALALPELIDQILQRLDLKDLLRAKGVCKNWQAVIDASPQLQENLFMRSRPGPVPVWKFEVTFIVTPIGPLSALSGREELSPQSNSVESAEEDGKYLHHLIPVQPNEILFPRRMIFNSTDPDIGDGSDIPLFAEVSGIQVVILRGNRDLQPVTRSPNDMLLTRPPVHTVRVELVFDSQQPQERQRWKINNPDGVRYGQLIESCLEHRAALQSNNAYLLVIFPRTVFCSSKRQIVKATVMRNHPTLAWMTSNPPEMEEVMLTLGRFLFCNLSMADPPLQVQQ